MPSRRLRLAARAARVLLWLLLSWWLVVGISWGLLHGWIVPRISDFRPRLEAEASRALGVPVRIGQIQMRSRGLIPSFELSEVTFLDREGRAALRLPSVLAALSPRSLWNLGFEQLVIEGAELDVRRLASGQIQVAGLELSQKSTNGGSAMADWALEQTELVLRGGTLRWTDDMNAAPPLALTQVDAVLRNPGQRHLVRLDATPPPAWGERFSLRAMLREPLLDRQGAPWQRWSGEVYGEFSRANVSQLKQYIRLAQFGIDVSSGEGALRAWLDLSKGQFTGGTADLALRGVSARLGQELQPLALSSVAGRFGGKRLSGGFEFHTEGLRFVADDGLVWPGGNVALLHTETEGRQPARTELKADKLDLAALARIARRLPLQASAHTLLDSFSPQGLVEQLEASWQGELSAPLALSARGRVSRLTLAAGIAEPGLAASPGGKPQPGRPGIENASVEFKLTQDGGQAQVQMASGALEFPGVFEQPRVLFNELSTEVSWQGSGAKREVQLRKLRFANADVAGQAEVRWRSNEEAPVPVADAAAGAAPVRRPGVLDLQGSLSRGDASQVHRYLPLVLPEAARHYVRDAVTQGRLNEVRFKVKGDLRKLPFADPKDGDFLVSANATNLRYAYVPAAAAASAKSWPALEALQGELVFSRQSLELRGVQGRVAGLAGLQLSRGSARIPDLARSVVEVNAVIRGPLAQGLQLVNNSPVSAMLGDGLLQTSATGPMDYSMRLMLPLAELSQTSVQGSLNLPGNDVQFGPETPLLGRLRGTLSFTENSLRVSNAQARLLGGDIRFEGGLRPNPGAARPAGTISGTASSPGSGSANGSGSGLGNANAPVNIEPLEAPLLFRGQGTVSAEGLRQARELGLISGLALHASGSTSYSAVLGFRRGQTELSVSSNLQGLALNLPAPLAKPAAEALPLQFERALLRESLAPGQRLQDQLSLTLGRLASVRYVRELGGAEPRVLRGSIGVGLAPGESAPSPEREVAANVNLTRADLDEWGRVLEASKASMAAGNGAARTTVNVNNASAAAQAYGPSVLALRAGELSVQGYPLHKVVLGASREGGNWRANMDADELSGYAEFRQPSAAPGGADGRLFARLSRLRLGVSTARDVEALLEDQPSAIPALDIVVDDFELRGKKLGRLDIEAVNRSAQQAASSLREWRLNKLNLTTPEAVFSANGNWAAGASSERRRVQMNFRLDIADSGELLKRLGMDGALRRGKGRLEGQVGWLGSPLGLDYPSLGGQFNVGIESGQFLKADPGLAKLLGVLSLQALPRRLTLDFRDVFSEGFTFDFVRGDVTIEQGQARTNNLQMKGINAAVLMEGSADIARETQDLRVVIVPELNAGTASLIATVINPAVGLGTFLAQMFLRRPLSEAATQEFHIDGGWSEPRIVRVERQPGAGKRP